MTVSNTLGSLLRRRRSYKFKLIVVPLLLLIVVFAGLSVATYHLARSQTASTDTAGQIATAVLIGGGAALLLVGGALYRITSALMRGSVGAQKHLNIWLMAILPAEYRNGSLISPMNLVPWLRAVERTKNAKGCPGALAQASSNIAETSQHLSA